MNAVSVSGTIMRRKSLREPTGSQQHPEVCLSVTGHIVVNSQTDKLPVRGL